MYKVDNAVIMAAGASSRFAPLSLERPKALIDVKGEVLIERQIRQLQEAGIPEVYVVVGYKAEQFDYLIQKYGAHIVHNQAYLTRNNHSSIFAVRDILKNTYICSADNYFSRNPFEPEVENSYYAALYAHVHTNEWCMQAGDDGYISRIDIGGQNAWYMLGHAFWSEDFSRKFLKILSAVYDRPETKNMFWEDILRNNLSELKMRIRPYPNDMIFEFDSLDELRLFDRSYVSDTRSAILKQIAQQLQGTEADITQIQAYKGTDTTAKGIRFLFHEEAYEYVYSDRMIRRIESWQERS